MVDLFRPKVVKTIDFSTLRLILEKEEGNIANSKTDLLGTLHNKN
jgi:hypothetical protein